MWTEEAQEAFLKLQKAITEAPVLTFPDFKPLIVETDASNHDLGAVLIQEGHPIAYFSKGFSHQNFFKSFYEKELIALVLAVQHWQPYLVG